MDSTIFSPQLQYSHYESTLSRAPFVCSHEYHCSIYRSPIFFAAFWNQINYLPTELQIANKAQTITCNRNNNYLFSQSEYFALINPSKLCIHLEEFFIKSLNETRMMNNFQVLPLNGWVILVITSPVTVNIYYFTLFRVCLKSGIQNL